MLVTDGHGVPSGGHVPRAQPAAIRLAAATLATVRVPRPRGRPRSRPRVAADKGSNREACRQDLHQRGMRACIPRRCEHCRRGRPSDLAPSRLRGIIERTIRWLGHFRRLVVRYERLVHL